MGALGTGVIAGVAQAALQSQQLGRQRDQRAREAKRAAERQKEILQIRVQGLEEASHAEDATRIRIDNQVPDHERHDQPERRSVHHAASSDDQLPPLPPVQAGPTAPPPLERPASAEPDAPPEPQSHVAAAYRHSSEQETHRLDVEA